MDELYGMKVTRRFSGPAAKLIDLVDDHARHHIAIHFYEDYHDHPALNDSLYTVLDFLQSPMLAGIAPLIEHDEQKGAFIFSTGKCWSVAEVIRVCADLGFQPGARAGLELMAEVGRILRDASQMAQNYAVYSHGGLTPWRILLKKTGQAEIIGYALPQVELLEFLEGGDPPREDSFRYCPPERLKKEPEEVDSDFYSLALIAFELMTTQPIYDGTVDMIRQKAARGEASRQIYQANFPAPVRDLLLKTLHAERRGRFESGQDFLANVERVLTLPMVEGFSLSEVMRRIDNYKPSSRPMQVVSSPTTVFKKEDALMASGRASLDLAFDSSPVSETLDSEVQEQKETQNKANSKSPVSDVNKSKSVWKRVDRSGVHASSNQSQESLKAQNKEGSSSTNIEKDKKTDHSRVKGSTKDLVALLRESQKEASAASLKNKIETISSPVQEEKSLSNATSNVLSALRHAKGSEQDIEQEERERKEREHKERERKEKEEREQKEKEEKERQERERKERERKERERQERERKERERKEKEERERQERERKERERKERERKERERKERERKERERKEKEERKRKERERQERERKERERKERERKKKEERERKERIQLEEQQKRERWRKQNMLKKELSDSTSKQADQERQVAAERIARHDQHRKNQHALPVSQGLRLEDSTDFFAHEEESSEEYCSEEDEATAMFVRPTATPKVVVPKEKRVQSIQESTSNKYSTSRAQSKNTKQCTILLPSQKQPISLSVEEDRTAADLISSMLIPQLVPFPMSALGKLTGWYLLYNSNKPLSGHTKVLDFYKEAIEVRFVPERMIQVHLTVSGSHPLRLRTVCSSTVPVSSLIDSWCDAFGLSKQAWCLWTPVRKLGPSEVLAGVEDQMTELILRSSI